MLHVVYTLLVLLGFSQAEDQDRTSSMAHLQQLADPHSSIHIVLEEFLAGERRHLAQIQQLLDELRNLSITNFDNIYHPVGAYQVVKRWHGLTTKIARYKFATGGRRELAELPEVLYSDVQAAAASLLRLQRVYRLPTDDIAHGNLLGRQSVPLDRSDFVVLGNEAMSLGEYGLAVQWLERALPDFQQKHHAHILHQIAQANMGVGDYDSSLKAIDRAIELDPMNITHHEVRAECYMKNVSFHREIGRGALKSANNWWRTVNANMATYEALCRGERIRVEVAWSAGAHCRHRKTKIPIVVVKEEVLSADPWIALHYDVISDAEITDIKNRAISLLSRAHVGDDRNTHISDKRVSKVGWLWDREPGIQAKLSSRVELISGLSTTYRETFSSAEPFQVVNYGLGGQYEPHYDFYEDPNSLENLPAHLLGTGDRMSTFLFYLSDVEAGGATVFPWLGVRVPVVKNAAAFWFNIKKNGDLDPRTLHAGCPVLMGDKWVANKWTRQHEQMFRRKCGSTSMASEDGY